MQSWQQHTEESHYDLVEHYTNSSPIAAESETLHLSQMSVVVTCSNSSLLSHAAFTVSLNRLANSNEALF